VLVGGFILPLIGAPVPAPEAMMSILLMAPQFVSAYSLPAGVLLPLWSIGVEELFYLFFPLAIRMLPLIRVCLVVIVGSTLLGIITAATDSPLFPLLRSMRFECMAVGALAAWLVVTRSRWLAVVHHRVIEIALIGMLLLIAFFRVPLPFYDLTFSIIVAVFLLNLSTNPDPFIRLEWRWSKAAGELSYGIYIWHLPVLWACSTVFSGLPFIGASLIATLLVALASYHLIERPILRLKDRFQPVRVGSRNSALSQG
jgi:peptidoglycan/LPS O-acetylase OafA/YrhL